VGIWKIFWCCLESICVVFDKLKNLKSNKEFMKYFSNTLWLLFDRVFKMGIGFFVIIYLSRYLGPEKFGILSYSQSLVSIFMAFASLGISQVVIRDLVKFPNKRDALLGTWFKMVMYSSLISILFLFIMDKYILEDSNFNIVFILSFTIIFQNFNLIIDSYFQSQVKSKYVVYISNIGFFISSFIKLYLIYFQYDLIYFVYTILFEVVILFIGFTYIYLYDKLSIFNWNFDREIAINYMKSAWPLVIVVVSEHIYTKIDQVMLNYLIDSTSVGYYAAAVKVISIFNFLPVIIVISIYPKIIEAKQKSQQNYLNLLEKNYRLILWINMIFVIGIITFSQFIINTLYGNQYTPSIDILTLLSLGMIFSALSGIFSKMLYIEHYEKKFLYRSIVGMVVNIILNYFLIQRYGINGAAIATVITLFIVNYVYDLFDKDLRKFYYLKLKCFIPKI